MDITAAAHRKAQSRQSSAKGYSSRPGPASGYLLPGEASARGTYYYDGAPGGTSTVGATYGGSGTFATGTGGTYAGHDATSLQYIGESRGSYAGRDSGTYEKERTRTSYGLCGSGAAVDDEEAWVYEPAGRGSGEYSGPYSGATGYYAGEGSYGAAGKADSVQAASSKLPKGATMGVVQDYVYKRFETSRARERKSSGVTGRRFGLTGPFDASEGYPYSSIDADLEEPPPTCSGRCSFWCQVLLVCCAVLLVVYGIVWSFWSTAHCGDSCLKWSACDRYKDFQVDHVWLSKERLGLPLPFTSLDGEHWMVYAQARDTTRQSMLKTDLYHTGSSIDLINEKSYVICREENLPQHYIEIQSSWDDVQSWLAWFGWNLPGLYGVHIFSTRKVVDFGRPENPLTLGQIKQYVSAYLSDNEMYDLASTNCQAYAVSLIQFLFAPRTLDNPELIKQQLSTHMYWPGLLRIAGGFCVFFVLLRGVSILSFAAGRHVSGSCMPGSTDSSDLFYLWSFGSDPDRPATLQEEELDWINYVVKDGSAVLGYLDGKDEAADLTCGGGSCGGGDCFSDPKPPPLYQEPGWEDKLASITAKLTEKDHKFSVKSRNEVDLQAYYDAIGRLQLGISPNPMDFPLEIEVKTSKWIPLEEYMQTFDWLFVTMLFMLVARLLSMLPVLWWFQLVAPFAVFLRTLLPSVLRTRELPEGNFRYGGICASVDYVFEQWVPNVDRGCFTTSQQYLHLSTHAADNSMPKYRRVNNNEDITFEADGNGDYQAYIEAKFCGDGIGTHLPRMVRVKRKSYPFGCFVVAALLCALLLIFLPVTVPGQGTAGLFSTELSSAVKQMPHETIATEPVDLGAAAETQEIHEEGNQMEASEIDCSGGGVDFAWSSSIQQWCCEHHNVGCSSD